MTRDFLFKIIFYVCMNFKYFVNALHTIKNKVGLIGDDLVIMKMKSVYFVTFNKIKITLNQLDFDVSSDWRLAHFITLIAKDL